MGTNGVVVWSKRKHDTIVDVLDVLKGVRASNMLIGGRWFTFERFDGGGIIFDATLLFVLHGHPLIPPPGTPTV